MRGSNGPSHSEVSSFLWCPKIFLLESRSKVYRSALWVYFTCLLVLFEKFQSNTFSVITDLCASIERDCSKQHLLLSHSYCHECMYIRCHSCTRIFQHPDYSAAWIYTFWLLNRIGSCCVSGSVNFNRAYFKPSCTLDCAWGLLCEWQGLKSLPH